MYTDKVEKYFLDPINEGILKDANAIGCVGNALYEDQVTMYLNIKEDRINKVSFQVIGSCACLATASAATELIKNMEVRKVFLLKEKHLLELLGGLPEGKIYCATLVLEAIKQAICKYEQNENKEGCRLCEIKSENA